MSLSRVMSRLPSTAAVSRPPLPTSTNLFRSVGAFKISKRFASRDVSGLGSKVCTVLGAQWGDEGKGKLVDVLAKKYDIIARFNGGSNAGHTLVVDGKKFAFHLLPCGMLYPNKLNVIGNGVVVHIPTLLKELKNLDNAGVKYDGRLKISDRAHLVFDFHQLVDGKQEKALKDQNIGTTGKGIGPTYASKATRNGIRVGDLLHFESFKRKLPVLVADMQRRFDFEIDINAEIEKYAQFRDLLKGSIIDTVHYVNSSLAKGKTVLAEGANAALLDLDFGTYPYVTSSSTTAGGVCSGLGIAPSKIDTAIGVVKAYTTRVGSGPFPTELKDAIGQKLRDVGHEYGTTTGRPRRCGWLDIPVLQYSHLINNYQSINITKLDVLSGLDEIKIGVAYKLNGKRLEPGVMPSHLDDLAAVEVEYETVKGWKTDISHCRTFEELPPSTKAYLKRIEELAGIPISWIGTGPGRKDMVTKGFQASV